MTDEFNPSPSIGERKEALIKSVRKWTRITQTELQFKVASLSLFDYSLLEESIRGRVKTKDVDIESSSFSFNLYGMFYDQGVGRGRKAGSAEARQLSAQQAWLSPVLDVAIEELADILEKKYADVAAGELVLKIPGQIETKITING